MPDPNTEHGLRVQLATALREAEELRDAANTWLAERDALRADVRRMRSALELYRHCRHASVECFCVKEARAALATGGDRG